MRAFRATDGSMRSEPMLDDEGNGVLCQEAVDARDELIERLCSIPPAPAALDFLLAHFGTDLVAEDTGRKRRTVVDAPGRKTGEWRTYRYIIAEPDTLPSARKTIIAHHRPTSYRATV